MSNTEISALREQTASIDRLRRDLWFMFSVAFVIAMIFIFH